MPVHVKMNYMRTTVEITPEHRSALLALAARRGEEDLSGILEEAIDMYLKGEADREERRRIILSLAGSIPEEDAEELRRVSHELRQSWR